MTFTERWDEAAMERALAGSSLSSLNARDATGATALWSAVYFGQTEWVRRLLGAGARVDAHDAAKLDKIAGKMHLVSIWHGIPEPACDVPTGASSLLHVAVTRVGSPEVVSLLLEHGIAVDARDAYGDTPLHIAAFSDQPAMIDLLVDRGADPNAIDRAGYAPLDHGWSKSGVLERLLARGASPDGGPRTPWHRDSYGWSVVEKAATFDRADVIRALFAAGADVQKHREALPNAAKHGNVECVRALLAAGAPTDAVTNWRFRDRTPLAAAAMYAWRSCAELLLPHCRGELDFALTTAVELSYDDLPSPPNDRREARREMVAWLLDQGAHPNAAVPVAGASEDEALLVMLLDRGGDANARDGNGESALVHAANLGRYRCARVLLSRGADPKARSHGGETAYAVAERAYRKANVHDARLVMNAIADAGGGPEVKNAAPSVAVKSGPAVGDRVSHAKFGAGAITAIDGEKLTIRFESGDTKTLLAKFLTLA